MEQKRRTHGELNTVYAKYGKQLRFPVYLGQALTEAPLEDLELSVRSYNCLKRAGMRTVGDLVEGIDGRTDLLKIRNLGMRSANEIMQAVMEYQYDLLSEEGKSRYLKRLAELNEDTITGPGCDRPGL